MSNLVIFEQHGTQFHCYCAEGRMITQSKPKHPCLNVFEKEEVEKMMKCHCSLEEAWHWIETQYRLLSTYTLGQFEICGRWTSTVVSWLRDHHHIQQYQPVDSTEAVWIEGASRGHYDMITQTVYHKDLWAFDQRSSYPSFLAEYQKDFYVPVKQGVYETLTQEQFERVNQSYGIFHCHVEGHSPRFMNNQRGYYTHFDLKIAKTEGLTITAIQDGQPNYLHYVCRPGGNYSEAHCVHGAEIFRELVDLLQSVKDDHPDCKIAKLIMSGLWGPVCQKNEEWIFFDQDHPLVIPPNYEATTETRVVDPTHWKVKIQRKSSPYKTNLARLKPFILARQKLFMYEKVLKPYWKYLVRIQTDGFLLNMPLCLFGADHPKIGEFGKDKKKYYQPDSTLERTIYVPEPVGAVQRLLGHRVMIVDTETTDLPQDSSADYHDQQAFDRVRMMEIAWIKFDSFNLESPPPVEHCLIQPDWPEELLNPEALAKHHLTYQQIQGPTSLPWSDFGTQFEAEVKECEFIIGHKISFDLNVIKSESVRSNLSGIIESLESGKIEMIDSINLGYPHLGRCGTLEELYQHFYQTQPAETHRAGGDVLSLYSCLKKMK